MDKVKLNCTFRGDTMPHYKKDGDSAMDIYAYKLIKVKNGQLQSEVDFPIAGYQLKPLERILIPSGLSVEFKHGIDADARPRSGLAIKHGVVVQLGTIDNNYRGDIGLIVFNLSNETYTINRGDRIGQVRFSKPIMVELEQKESISDTIRGTSGYGNSGK